MKRWLAINLGLAFTALASAGAGAQTIYPLDRAEILAGARFDLKVEFPGSPPEQAVKVTINGESAATVSGKPARYVEREDGLEHAAYWIRGVTIGRPGRYTVEASAGDRSARVTWE